MKEQVNERPTSAAGDRVWQPASIQQTNGEPSGVPSRYVARLGLTFCFDTMLVDDESPAMVQLRDLHEQGWINLTRTDTLDTELGQRQDSDHRRELLDRSNGYVEHLGPAHWGHSRWGSSVWATDDDQADFERIFTVLFPESDPNDVTEPRHKQRFRDAKHVHTASRYGANGLITRDRKDLLSRSTAIKEALNGFLIVSPEDALIVVQRIKARAETRAGRRS